LAAGAADFFALMTVVWSREDLQASTVRVSLALGQRSQRFHNLMWKASATFDQVPLTVLMGRSGRLAAAISEASADDE
jgi:hypothetical protein